MLSAGNIGEAYYDACSRLAKIFIDVSQNSLFNNGRWPVYQPLGLLEKDQDAIGNDQKGAHSELPCSKRVFASAFSKSCTDRPADHCTGCAGGADF